MYERSIREEFTHQSESFARSAAMSSDDMLGSVVELIPADQDARWIEVACGPGLIARQLAGKVGSVHGVDLTPAMVERARRETETAGLANVDFSEGDATALPFEEGSFDGAVTRLSFHHIPAPRRVLEEMSRVVRPGGWVVVADLLTDEAREAAAWHQEIDRLRDPSHWATLTARRLRSMGDAVGLELDAERTVAVGLHFEDWRERGSGGRQAAALIDRLLEEAPESAESFRVVEDDGTRRLHLRFQLLRWRTPGQS